MKTAAVSVACLAALQGAVASVEGTNPVSQAVELLADLKVKIEKDGVAEGQVMQDYRVWCGTAKGTQANAIADAKDGVQEAEAHLQKATASSSDAQGKIKLLLDKITKNDADLADATRIRDQENGDFSSEQKELSDSIDTLGRAIGVLETELKSSPESSALLQTKVDKNDQQALLSTLTKIMEAAAIPTADRKALLVLTSTKDALDLTRLDEPGVAPVYEQQSSSILDVLENLQSKAEKELIALRKQEAAASHAFGLLQQSIKFKLEVDKKELQGQRADKSEADRQAGAAQGEKDITSKDLSEAQTALQEISTSCKDAERNRDDSIKMREEELKAIDAAVEVLNEMTGSAVDRVYAAGAPSFTQISAMKTPDDLTRAEIEQMIRKAGEDDHTVAMSQLKTAIGSARSGDFGRVGELIKDLITKLEAEGANDNKKKEYCDKELTETGRKATALQLDAEKYTSRKDIATSKVTTLTEEVAKARAELVASANEQSEADRIRAEEKEAYDSKTKDLTTGLEGVRTAVQVLREFYRNKVAFMQIKEHQAKKQNQPAAPTFFSKSKADGDGVVNLLEIVESDMGSALSKTKSNEDAAIREYKAITQNNKEIKANKQADVDYMSKAIASLEKAVRGHDGDLATTNSEIATNKKYFEEISAHCADQGPTYQQRKAKREAEIKNLKDAIASINSMSKPALLQTPRLLRGK